MKDDLQQIQKDMGDWKVEYLNKNKTPRSGWMVVTLLVMIIRCLICIIQRMDQQRYSEERYRKRKREGWE